MTERSYPPVSALLSKATEMDMEHFKQRVKIDKSCWKEQWPQITDALRAMSHPEYAPNSVEEGICFELSVIFPGPGNLPYNFCRNVFGALGFDDLCDPLEDYFRRGDRWAGERGTRRRELAGLMADVWEGMSK